MIPPPFWLASHLFSLVCRPVPVVPDRFRSAIDPKSTVFYMYVSLFCCLVLSVITQCIVSTNCAFFLLLVCLMFDYASIILWPAAFMMFLLLGALKISQERYERILHCRTVVLTTKKNYSIKSQRSLITTNVASFDSTTKWLILSHCRVLRDAVRLEPSSSLLSSTINCHHRVVPCLLLSSNNRPTDAMVAAAHAYEYCNAVIRL
jgi:hypothetical protein